MNQTKQQSESSQSPTFAITPSGVAIKINSCHGIWTAPIFCSITAGAIIGVSLYGYLCHYTWIDWSLFGLLYVVSGLGITVGYHRLMAHRGFNCPNWIKCTLLIRGAWALQNSAIKWAADHLRHHARCAQEKDPYNAQHGFWHSHCGWLFITDRYADSKYATRVANDPVAIWQHKYYPPSTPCGPGRHVSRGLSLQWRDGWNRLFSPRRRRTHIRHTEFDVFHQLHLSFIYGDGSRTALQTPVEIAGSCPS